MKLLRADEEALLQKTEALYMEAFPKSERKPWELIVQKHTEGTMEILSVLDDENTFLGLAIFAFDQDLALLDYFAMSPENRGQGTGSQALQMLQQKYAGKRLILEIETTKKPCAESEVRERRKAFYLRNGLHVMDFDVLLFGVEMEILANCDHVTFEEYLNIYLHACNPKFKDKILKAQPFATL